MLETKVMNDKEKKEADLDFFDQIDEALEERKGTDRRQQSDGSPVSEERRKNDRRQPD